MTSTAPQARYAPKSSKRKKIYMQTRAAQAQATKTTDLDLGPKTQNSENSENPQKSQNPQNSKNSQNYQNPQNFKKSQNQHTTPSTPQSSSLPVGDKDESNRLSPFPESLTSQISSIDENTSAKPENASSTNSNNTNSDPAASRSNTNKFTNKYRVVLKCRILG